MGRRIQGYIQRVKHDEQTKRTAETEQKETGKKDDMINISKADLVSGIVGGMADAAEKTCSVQKANPDTEISEDFINTVAAKVQELQKQAGGEKGDPNSRSGQEEGQKSRCEQNKLQTLVARLLLGGKGGENQPENKNQSANNPILAANDSVIQESKGQAGKSTKNSELKPDMTAKIASEVLAKAQYELSKELEANLQKLRQVIAESEQVAQKISKLLQESGNSDRGQDSGGQE